MKPEKSKLKVEYIRQKYFLVLVFDKFGVSFRGVGCISNDERKNTKRVSERTLGALIFFNVNFE